MRRPAILPLLILLAACGSEGPVSPPADDPVPATVEVSTATLAFGALGSRATVGALVRNAAGNVLDTVPVTWSHRVPGVAAVNSAGVVTSLGNGVDTVIATAGAAADTVVVTIEQLPVSVALTGVRDFTYLGETFTLTGTVVDSNSRPVFGPVVTWASSDSAVYVSSAGQVTAARPGGAMITAASGTLAASAAIAINLTGPVGGAVTGAAVPCGGGMAGPFPCQGLDLVSYLPVSALGGAPGVDLNDVWGWTDPMTGTEWALVGRRDGIAFVSLEDPANPRYAGFLLLPAGISPNFWHDVKVYQNHAFVVADNASQHGMQVFDLTRLRTPGPYPVWYTADARYTGVASVHNIAINEATGFAYLVGSNAGGTTCGGGLHMVDISTPTSPAFAGCFADPLTGRSGTGYTHDVQCVVYSGPDPDYTGREICLGSNETHLSIADVTSKSAPVAVSRATYPNVRYTHQGWLSEDQRYFFVNDELDEGSSGVPSTRTMIWDVADLDDPILVNQYFGPTTAIDHNHYVVGNRLYASNYQYGLRVLDITDPVNPVQVGHFDTAPTQPDTPGFGGSWSNYPFFASGIIVVTSDIEGLFVLRVP